MGQVDTYVGPLVGATGTNTGELRVGWTGEQIVNDAHGRYHEAVARGNVFMAANQASTTFTLFGTTTATGFILYNPANSGKLLSVLNLGYNKITVAAAQIENLVISAAYAGQTLSSLTALITRSAIVGSAATGVGIAYSAATLSAAGVIIQGLHTPSVSATAALNNGPPSGVDIAGGLVIMPGAWIQIAAGFTNTLTGLAHAVWEEVPLLS